MYTHYLVPFTNIYKQLFFLLHMLPITTSKQDEGEMDHAGHGCLLSALRGHDLLFHMAISDAKAADR